MQLHPLKPRAATAACFGGAISGLIEAVGLDEFPRRLFGAARAVAGCKHMTAFSFARGEPPRLLLAENVGERAVARKVADRYLSHYWRLDPIRDALADLPETDDVHAIELGVGDIRYADYRADCYTSVRLRSQLAINQVREQSTIRLNFFRADGFGSDQRARILDSIDLLMPLLWRHEVALRPRPVDLRAEFRRRLAQRDPCLSGRELDVCMLIAVGLSSQGIALELGISLNTVLTYRKRAYMRLGISSQNELLRSIMI
jgi:LuxR family transcriptional regulator, activator of tox operons